MNRKNESDVRRAREHLEDFLKDVPASIEEGIPLSDLLEEFASAVEEVYRFQREFQGQQALCRRTEALDVVSALSTELRQILTFDETVSLLIDITMSVLDVDTNALLILEEDELVVTAGQNLKEGLVGRRTLLADSPLKVVFAQGESLFVTDETSVPELSRCTICKDLTDDSAAGAFVRLRTGEAPIGLLYVGYATARTFDTHDKSLLDMVGGISGNALYRASTLDLLEQRVTDRTQKLTALYNITAAASGSLNRSTVLKRSLREVLSSAVGDAGSIHLFNEATGTLEFAHQHVVSAEETLDDPSLLPGRRLADSVFQNEQPIVVNDLHTDQRVGQTAQKSGFRSCVVVPMHAGGNVLGVLSIYSRKRQQFSVDEVALTNSIADHIAVSVENTWLHQKAQQLAVQEERRRLARELHDSVTQLLYSISIFAGTGRELAKKEAWSEIPRLYTRMDETALQALKEMKLLLGELEPAAPPEAELQLALHRRLGAIERRFGVNLRLVVEQPVNMIIYSADVLYQVVNDVLNDVLEHAVAREVMVSISEETEYVVVEVTDDGEGFDTSAVDNSCGRAFASLRERVERAGGTLTVASTVSEGTVVTIRLKKESFVTSPVK